MKPDETLACPWTLSRRANVMQSSVLREMLKVGGPGIISLAGGLPAPETFPIDAFSAACERVLRNDGAAALQYAASEGYGPLREAVAAMLPWNVAPNQVLITTGSQQGLDLAAKVLLDPGSRMLVEMPTYMGALQAFGPMEPQPVGVASDGEGALPDDMADKALGDGMLENKARFAYLVPNFQNPTGRSMGEARRTAVIATAARTGLPLLEDNPYGELWFDQPPPAPLASRNPEGVLYFGSFSKVLAPGLRLGFLVAPRTLYPKLLQAKQAVDLHTPIFTQRVVAEVIRDGFLGRHVPAIRARYRVQRDAMVAAIRREMQGMDVQFTVPAGGMFLWLRLPVGIDTGKMLSESMARGVAYVPGAPFYSDGTGLRELRLSFATVGPAQIDIAIAALARTLREALDQSIGPQ
ncbi:PLP-dependent aminotransferase family protein [Acidovorax sp. SDU_ACID1]|uniref:PLP-dependent aminotransferase family protein n=1 Tax=Acidovorax sp. SDU_ACID1 TaxID=3136632 RepID=UPI0038733B49